MAWDWNAFATTLGFAVPMAGMAFSGWHWVNTRKEEMRQRRYENFHEIVSVLISGRNGDGNTFVDSQVAACFELRNYPEYAEVTCRIINGLLAKWRPHMHEPGLERLVHEGELTVAHLSKSKQ